MTSPMSDDRVDRILRDLAEARAEEVAAKSLAPAAFAERLLGRSDTKFARWRVGWLLLSGTVRMAVILGLLAVALLAALVGAFRPDPNELVRLSQAVHKNPPPFTMTIRPPGDRTCNVSDPTPTDITWRYLYDGTGTVRFECLSDSEARDYSVANDRVAGYWSGTSWDVGPAGDRPGVPLATVEWLNWVNAGDLDPGVVRPEGNWVTCPSWRLEEIEEVAGRSARPVSCGRDRYWIDEASRLLLKVDLGGTIVEALELQVGTAPPAALLEIEDVTEVRRALRAGQIPPPWALRLVSGGTFELASLRGRPAAVLFATGCRAPCLTLPEFDSIVAARAGRLSAAAVLDSPARVELTQAALAAIPVVVDDHSQATGWAFEGWRSPVVLFDADGRVVKFTDPRSTHSLAAILDAFLTGAPIPFPPIGDGVFLRGHPAPPLTAAVAANGMLDLATLRGKPVVVVSPASGNLGDSESRRVAEALIDEIAEAARLIGQDATFLVIAWDDTREYTIAPEWPDVLAGARARHGEIVDELLLVEGHSSSGLGGSHGSGWGTSGWTALRSGGDPDHPSSAIVVIDPNGVVADLLWGEGLPDGAELASVVRALVE